MDKLVTIAASAKYLKENGYKVKVVGGKRFKMIFARKNGSSLEIYITDDEETAQGVFQKNLEFYLDCIMDEESGFEMESEDDFCAVYDRKNKKGYGHLVMKKANRVYVYHGTLGTLALKCK